MANEAEQNFLDGLKFVFVSKKLSKLQHAIVREKILKFGGVVANNFDNTITHVIFPRNVTFKEGLESMKVPGLPNQTLSVSMEWITSCIASRKILPTPSYEIRNRLVDNVSIRKGEEEKEVRSVNDIVTLNISGTSKFSSSKEVVNAYESRRESEGVFELDVKKTLAYGSKYGLGVFCYLKSGEHQIGWIPEKNNKLHEKIQLMCQHPRFRVRLIKATAKTVSETFSRVDITILCEVK